MNRGCHRALGTVPFTTPTVTTELVTVVFIHSVAGSPAQWAPQLRHLQPNFDVRESNQVMVGVSKVKGDLGWLGPPASLGNLAVADVVGADADDEHRAAVTA